MIKKNVASDKFIIALGHYVGRFTQVGYRSDWAKVFFQVWHLIFVLSQEIRDISRKVGEAAVWRWFVFVVAFYCAKFRLRHIT